MSQQEQSKVMKELGNEQFKNENYEQAVKFYTQAIDLFPTSIYYSNRSRSYRILKEIEKSYHDAEKAIQLDDKNIKGYFLMGETLMELANQSRDPLKIQQAIEKLRKSLTLCPSQGKNQFQERFVEEIYRAKKNLWELRKEVNLEKKKALRSYLTNLVESDENLEIGVKDDMNQKIQNLLNKNIQTEKVIIPEPLICHISKILMKEPVCNQFGNSYSKACYLQELSKNGKVDPISNKKLNTTILYPNINLKKAIEHFLDKHPWAYQAKQE